MAVCEHEWSGEGFFSGDDIMWCVRCGLVRQYKVAVKAGDAYLFCDDHVFVDGLCVVCGLSSDEYDVIQSALA